MCKDAAQHILVEIADVGNHAFLDADEINQSLGEIAHRKHEIGDAGCYRTARHRGVFGLVRVLHQDDATGFLHSADADRAVRCCAAQDYGKAIADPFGDRAEEEVYWRALAARLAEFRWR